MISYVLHHHHADHFEAMSWARENTRHPAFYQSIPVVTEGRTSPWFGSAIQWVDFQASERRFVLAFESDADALHFKMRWPDQIAEEQTNQPPPLNTGNNP